MTLELACCDYCEHSMLVDGILEDTSTTTTEESHICIDCLEAPVNDEEIADLLARSSSLPGPTR